MFATTGPPPAGPVAVVSGVSLSSVVFIVRRRVFRDFFDVLLEQLALQSSPSAARRSGLTRPLPPLIPTLGRLRAFSGVGFGLGTARLVFVGCGVGSGVGAMVGSSVAFEIRLERRRGLDRRLGRRFDSWRHGRLRGRSRGLGRRVGRLRIYFERVLIFIEREFFRLGRLGLDLRLFGFRRLGLRLVRRVPINPRQDASLSRRLECCPRFLPCMRAARLRRDAKIAAR